MSLPSPPESTSVPLPGDALVERVVAVAAGDAVVAVAAGERVRSAAAAHRVVARAAVEDVVSQVARQRVAARAAGEILDVRTDGVALARRAVVGRAIGTGVHPCRAVGVGHDVLAGAAGERVGGYAAGQRVIAVATRERHGDVEGGAEVGAVADELEVVRTRSACHRETLGLAPNQVGRRVAVEIRAERAAEDDIVVVAEKRAETSPPAPQSRARAAIESATRVERRIQA